jgi:hypothetical protein
MLSSKVDSLTQQISSQDSVPDDQVSAHSLDRGDQGSILNRHGICGLNGQSCWFDSQSASQFFFQWSMLNVEPTSSPVYSAGRRWKFELNLVAGFDGNFTASMERGSNSRIAGMHPSLPFQGVFAIALYWCRYS